MALDTKIQEAVSDSVKNHQQPADLGRTIIAALSEIVNGNLSIDDQGSIFMALENILNSMSVTIDAQDELQE